MDWSAESKSKLPTKDHEKALRRLRVELVKAAATGRAQRPVV
ncbi:MAG: hypothetical protein QOC89_569 [Paraburkholderia sp.]|nr:hypothetical protein [Paraburkholderia sp.]